MSLTRHVASLLFAVIPLLCVGISPGYSQCDISGPWTQTVYPIGSSVWTYSPLGVGRYYVEEKGFGNALGTAIVSGFTIHVEWRTADGSVAGVADWAADAYCSNGEGRQVIHNGGWAGAHDAIWERTRSQ